jgi:hypothetical protein
MAAHARTPKTAAIQPQTAADARGFIASPSQAGTALVVGAVAVVLEADVLADLVVEMPVDAGAGIGLGQHHRIDQVVWTSIHSGLTSGKRSTMRSRSLCGTPAASSVDS